MTRTIARYALPLLLCLGAQAATTNTTLTVHATAPFGAAATITATGTATLSNIGSGTFTGTLDITTLKSTFTIALSGGNLTGTLTISPNLLAGSGTGSATITGGTGSYANASGSFPSLAGTGSTGASGIVLDFSGGGQIITGGTTGGGGGTSTTPTITAVWDAASNTASLAQGSIFIVKGSNLCPKGVNVFSPPRPTVSPDGVKITFAPVAGGGGTDAILVYTYNPSGTCQLAGILPSTVPPGNYNVTVTNGSASAPVATVVKQRKFSLFTQDSSGSGLGSVQNYISSGVVDLNSFTTGTGKSTTISPAHPGQYVIAWGTGMGPLVGGDNSASPAFDFSANGVKVNAIVGGVTVPVAYAGRAGYAGEDQINVQLPANVPTGCTVPFQISVDGVLSNQIFIAIAPDANSNACVQPGFTTSQLQQFDAGASKTFGYFSLTQFTMTIPQFGTAKTDAATGGFTRYTGYQLASLSQAQTQVSTTGSCTVTHVTSSNQTGVASPFIGGLDAGSVTLNGPSGSGLSSQLFTQDPLSFQYSLNLGVEGVPIPGGLNVSLLPGTYSVSGAGGADVGKFSASIALGAPLNLSAPGLPSNVNRSTPLTLNWTGGSASDLVQLIGSSSTTSGVGASAVTDTWSFICTTTAGAGTISVPSSVLQQLPAVSASSNSGGGSLFFGSTTNPTSFQAPLTAGGNVDSAYFLAFTGMGALVSYQ